jgi:hypothetical protein
VVVTGLSNKDMGVHRNELHYPDHGYCKVIYQVYLPIPPWL